MYLGIEGKRALVTGSTSGIGAAIAEALAGEGVRVVIHGRDRDRAEAVAARIGAAGIALGDLRSAEGADAVEAATRQALGDIDILVNNSGGSEGSAGAGWLETTDDYWAQTHEINAIAAARMIRRFLPGMQQAGWGRVVQVTSVAGVMPQPIGPHYGAAKAAMINLSLSLAKAMGGTGITSNSVSPGTILTPSVERHIVMMCEKLGWGDLPLEQGERRLVSEHYRTPAGRFGRPHEIAHAVLMLCGEGGAYITGANIRVDGGMVPTVN